MEKFDITILIEHCFQLTLAFVHLVFIILFWDVTFATHIICWFFLIEFYLCSLWRNLAMSPFIVLLWRKKSFKWRKCIVLFSVTVRFNSFYCILHSMDRTVHSLFESRILLSAALTFPHFWRLNQILGNTLVHITAHTVRNLVITIKWNLWETTIDGLLLFK